MGVLIKLKGSFLRLQGLGRQAGFKGLKVN
jgi:hypothetical protein